MSKPFAMNYLIRGDHFDSEFPNKVNDLEFYLGIAGKKPLRILELGVGTGRISIPLARLGHAVTASPNDKLDATVPIQNFQTRPPAFSVA